MDENILLCLQKTVQGSDAQAVHVELEKLSKVPGFLTVLMKVMAGKEFESGVRQAAGVIFKNHVIRHWDTNVQEVEKSSIREAFRSRAFWDQPFKKLRKITAVAITAVAEHDYPTKWSDFLDTIMYFFNSQEVNLVHSALSVLTEFLEHILDCLVPQIATHSFLRLLTIFKGDNAELRTDALKVFNLLLEKLIYMRFVENEQAAELVQQSQEPWLKEILALFVKPMKISVEMIAVQSAAVNTMNVYVKNAPELALPFFSSFIEGLIRVLSTYLSSWEHLICSKDGTWDQELSNKLRTFFDVVIDLLGRGISSSESDLKELVKGHVDDLMPFALGFMWITDQQVVEYKSDPGSILEAEDLDVLNWTLRASAKDFVDTLVTLKGLGSLCKAMEGSLRRAEAISCESKPHAWKPREVAVWGSGYIASQVSSSQMIPPTGFELPEVLRKLIIPELKEVRHELLTGAALKTLAKLWRVVNVQVKHIFLESILEYLKAKWPFGLRLFAADAFQDISAIGDSNLDEGMASKAVEMLCPLLPKCGRSTLQIVLRALKSALSSSSEEVIKRLEPQLTREMLNLWELHADDPLTSDAVLDIFGPVCSFAAAEVQQKILPVCVNLLSGADKGPEVKSRALSLCSTLLKSLNSAKFPVSDYYFTSLLPQILQMGIQTVNTEMLSEICNFLRLSLKYLSHGKIKNVDQVRRELVRFCLHLLKPSLEGESGVVQNAGTVIWEVFDQLHNQIGSSDMKALLDIVVEQISLKGDLQRTMDLLLVLARLQIKHQAEMLEYFKNIGNDPNTQHRNLSGARRGTLSIWVEYHELFGTRFQKKISLMGLLSLLCNDPTLFNIPTKGWPIVEKERTSTSRQRCTRSSGSANLVKYSTVPLPARILGHVIEQLVDLNESLNPPVVSTFDSPLDPDEFFLFEHDPEEENDTIFPRDFKLKGYLEQFLKEFSKTQLDRLRGLAGHLPSNLKKNLEALLN